MLNRIKSLSLDTKITIVLFTYITILFTGIALRIIYLFNTGYYL